MIIENLKTNKYPNDVHKMTGPAAYSKAIRECINVSQNCNYREIGVDYEGKFKFHYRFSKFFLYGFFSKKSLEKNAKRNISIKDLIQYAHP
jgi:hypothetical protein